MHFFCDTLKTKAEMAELADAYGSGPYRYYFCAGSSPVFGINHNLYF